MRIMSMESPNRPPYAPPSRRHVAPRMTAMPMYTTLDRTTANMVPKGSDFWALRSSPEMLAPAIIPVTAGKNTEKIDDWTNRLAVAVKLKLKTEEEQEDRCRCC